MGGIGDRRGWRILDRRAVVVRLRGQGQQPAAHLARNTFSITGRADLAAGGEENQSGGAASGSRLAAGISTAHDPHVPFHVRLRFGPPTSPAVTGTWSSSEIAERKFRGFIGRYGSRADVRIELLEETASGQLIVAKRWTKDRGEETRPGQIR
ncbi:hypothetical protein [Streptomyces sp. NPDC023588]|uniref:hypothetical protein n=1 Tax=Streptomyces sp. NPDC023588 TaxID=3154907 RepID=UPI0033DB7FBF